MKKKINKKNVPAYAFGMDQLPNYLGGANVLGSAISGLSGEGSTGDAIGSTLGSAASLAGTGFSIGGPIGAAAGGVLGAAFGWIGSRRRKKQMEQMRRRKETMNKTQLGMNAAANQTAEYWDDNVLAYTYENGGILPDLAYVDNNEVIRGDDGTIMQVPNNRPGTDNHLIDASNLESVLSDKIKRPGTNKTFAQEGKKLTRMTKPSKGKDIFADNTNMLNKRNANFAYDNLLSEQEEVKAKKGIKPKKKGIPAYEDGKPSNKTPFYIPINYGSLLGGLPTFLLNTAANSLSANYVYNPNNKKTKLDPNKRIIQTYGSAPAFYAPMTGDGIDAVTYANDEPISVDTPVVPTKTVSATPAVNTTKSVPSKNTTKTPSTSSTKTVPNYNFVDAPMLDIEEPVIGFNDAYTQPLEAPKKSVATKPDLSPISNTVGNKKSPKDKAGVIDYSPDWLSLAPTVYNALQSLRNPEYEQTVLNPYTGAITNTMARRRMNIEPARLANSRSRAISNYNLANINANTGANLAARTQAAVDEYASNANMYATKQNADNAYLGEYANTLNNLGQQFVQSENMYNDLNARNRAAARNFGATATSQLGKWSQVNRQMQNQYNRDQMTLPFLADFLSQGFTKEQVDNLLTRTRNRV
nr:MAG: bacteriocin class II with double-glycine leader peptide [Bacteriophage sp.]